MGLEVLPHNSKVNCSNKRATYTQFGEGVHFQVLNVVLPSDCIFVQTRGIRMSNEAQTSI